MRTDDEVFTQFLELWKQLQGASEEPGTLILVEGERDRASLRALGIRGPVVLVHRGHRLSGVAQELAAQGRRVIILTDWDVEGGHLAQRLHEFLDAGALAVDLDSRRRLARTLRGEVVHVEGLAGWARRMATKAGAPLEHFLAVAD